MQNGVVQIIRVVQRRGFQIRISQMGCFDGFGTSFTMLHDKQMSSSEVVLASWCPTMDLLSILTDDNQLTVYRLDFQRVWIACPETPITALAWRPDGEDLTLKPRKKMGSDDARLAGFSTGACL